MQYLVILRIKPEGKKDDSTPLYELCQSCLSPGVLSGVLYEQRGSHHGR